MNKKINLEILLKEGFVPLEESREGTLKGGFASLASVSNNCNCKSIPNDCKCNGNSCNKPWSELNTNCPCNSGIDNCECLNYACPTTTSASTKTAELPFI